MSTQKDKPTIQTVSSVGDSWIVCNSKSHPRHVYYFNTVTGEAVWNLSEAEIKRARLTTLLNAGLNPTVCPEPKDNPPMLKALKQQLNSGNNLYQLKLQNNLFHQPQQSLMQRQSGAPYSDIQMNDVPTFDMNSLNHQINSLNVTNLPAVYNPNPWSIPPTQQYIITPPIPVVNQTPSSLNVGYNQLIQHDSPHPSRFNNFQYQPNTRRRFFQPFNRLGQKRNFNEFHQSKEKMDLRQHLSLKRQLNSIYMNRVNPSSIPEGIAQENNESSINIPKSADVSSHIGTMTEDLNMCNEENSVDNHSGQLQMEQEPSKLDVTPLIQLAPLNTNLDIWYLVVDLNILLDEYKFLSKIIDSDKHCHLLIPDQVMSDLKDFISRTNNIPARKMYHSISQKIDSGIAFIAGKPSQDYGDTITNNILRTCLEVCDENYHVILLTNDTEILSYKKFIKINMFTVEEVKCLLKGSMSCSPSLIMKNSKHDSIIKTAVPGSKSFEFETTTNKPESEDIVATKPESENDQTVPLFPSKHTVDAGIQTDMASVTGTGTSIVNLTENKQDSNENQATQGHSINPVSNDLNTPSKRRIIQLKRSASSQPLQRNSLGITNEKRTLRWHRKRSMTCQAYDSSNSKVDKGVDTAQIATTEPNEEVKQLEEITNDIQQSEPSLDCSEIMSKDSSVIYVEKGGHNITIEETSTSGIISNTDSNIDTESHYNACKSDDSTNYENIINEVLVVYEVDSENMKESLKSKCEEWVSSFIQIMEDVLTIVLHNDPAFSQTELPPPWTLHEAAQCIRKHSNNVAVRYTTDKLSNILFQISNDAGKISMSITPHQYMEMYSYGVSLLRALKAITTHHEDIEIAEESLQTLLTKIKNPYCSSNDSSIDAQDGCSVIQDSSIVHEHVESEPEKENVVESADKSLVEYNLRSKTTMSVEDTAEPPQPVRIIRNIDIKSDFFRSLSLKKVSEPIDTATESNGSLRCQDQANKPTYITFSSGDNEIACDDSLNKPTILRNFTKCAEFEEKLKNKFNSRICEKQNEYLDYEEDYDYSSGECRSEEFDASDESAMQSDPNVAQRIDPSDNESFENFVPNSQSAVDPSLDSHSNDMFRFMTCMFLQEVRKAISQVKMLCDKCYAELKDPKLTIKERNELRNRTENAHLHIVGLCTSLESMLDRDPNASTDNIQTVLKKAGLNISHVDENLLSEYWNTIANCKKRADVFLDSIQEIIASFKSLDG